MAEPINYLAEAKRLAREVFMEEADMSEEEYDEFITLLREKKGWSYEQMAKDLETGVNNGYSIEFQASLLKAYVKL